MRDGTISDGKKLTDNAVMHRQPVQLFSEWRWCDQVFSDEPSRCVLPGLPSIFSSASVAVLLLVPEDYCDSLTGTH